MFADTDLLKVKGVMDRGKIYILNVDFLVTRRVWQKQQL